MVLYKDRGYLTANFVTQIPSLANSVETMLKNLNYKFSEQKLNLDKQRLKFTFRIHKNALSFIKEIGLEKK